MHLGMPGPDAATLGRMLTIAARVPDHGKLTPWRFVIVGPEGRKALCARLEGLRKAADAELTEERLAKDRAAFVASPVIVIVVSTAQEHPKIPLWEQHLSAGAVCTNLLHAAHGFGFRAQWLTGWAAYDKRAKSVFGVSEDEQIAGFIHIGSSDLKPDDRPRPDIDALTSVWQQPG